MNFEWLTGVDPLWGTVAALVLYGALLVFALSRPRESIYEGASDRARWRDLRWWIVPLILAQLALYVLLR